MVTGLNKFREYFSRFKESYIMIGGAACSIIFEDIERPFRTTRDLDIVLCVEAVDPEFVKTFWEFIGEGKYKLQEKSRSDKNFYRFQKPEDDSFPFMLELFSRSPNTVLVNEGQHLTPIPVDDDVSSLSAILLDNDYYDWIKNGVKDIGGIQLVGPEYLIPLKARAWLDLSQRKREGTKIDSKTISKHKKDIFRLAVILDIEVLGEIPDKIHKDISEFLEGIEEDQTNPKDLGLSYDKSEIIEVLREAYRI